jgi:hypothetical protein
VGTDGTYNEVVGFDGIIRVFGQDYLDVKYAQSFDDSYKNAALSFDASRIWFDWQRRNEDGFGYDFFFSRAGDKYEPDLGFEFRKNYYMAGTKLKYGIIAGESSVLSRQVIQFNAQAWKDIDSYTTQSALIQPGYTLELKSGAGSTVNFSHAYESLTDTFYLSNDDVIAYIEPGNYAYNYVSLDINTPFTRRLFFRVFSNMGQYYDGNQFTMRLMSTLKLGAFLSLEPSYEYDRIRFPTRDQSFTGHIASLKSVLMLNNKLSVSALVEYSNIVHGMVTNIRLRFNPKEGNDLYVVYNEGRNIELDRVSPVLNPVANRGILIKYTYTFTL